MSKKIFVVILAFIIILCCASTVFAEVKLRMGLNLGLNIPLVLNQKTKMIIGNNEIINKYNLLEDGDRTVGMAIALNVHIPTKIGFFGVEYGYNPTSWTGDYLDDFDPNTNPYSAIYVYASYLKEFYFVDDKMILGFGGGLGLTLGMKTTRGDSSFSGRKGFGFKGTFYLGYKINDLISVGGDININYSVTFLGTDDSLRTYTHYLVLPIRAYISFNI
jgi:hypothetical protein